MLHKVISKQANSKDCFVCGSENESGLQVSFYEIDNRKIVCVFNAKTAHEGHPGILHGGIICSILDETAGRAMSVIDPEMSAYTIELNTQYLIPVPSNTQLTAAGWLDEVREKVYIAIAEIYLPDGRTAARGRGVYYIINKDKIADSDDCYHKVYPVEQDLFEIDIPDSEN
ncbi:MAG: PaaI family thioesterase [Bacillota bacterium]|nr:PaaI family thioesterase [Bacillota bacterium]